ncbi:hypothetical protein D3C80_2041000 [compost metagenome]
MQGRGAIVGGNDLVGKVFELLGEQHTVGGMIVHHQYTQRALRRVHWHCAGFNRLRRCGYFLQDQLHANPGTHADLALDT